MVILRLLQSFQMNALHFLVFPALGTLKDGYLSVLGIDHITDQWYWRVLGFRGGLSVLEHWWCIKGTEAKTSGLSLSKKVLSSSFKEGFRAKKKNRLSWKYKAFQNGSNYPLAYAETQEYQGARLSNSYGLRSIECDGIHPPDPGCKKCNLIIQILTINEVDHQYLASRNATYCVLLYYP